MPTPMNQVKPVQRPLEPTSRVEIGRLQSPSRPAFPYGRDMRDTMTVGHAINTPRPGESAMARVESGEKLVHHLHGAGMRTGLVNASRAQGYPPVPRSASGAASAPPTPSYARQMDAAYPWSLPPMQAAPEGSHYTDSKVTLNSGPETVSPSSLATYRHETDHALQVPHSGQIRGTPQDVVDFGVGAEVGPSLGDALWLSHDHQATTGRPLAAAVNYPSGYSQDLGWMTRQAQQHGLYGGRSMTQLLATPAGQQYLDNVVSPAPASPAATPPQGGGWGDWMIHRLGF